MYILKRGELLWQTIQTHAILSHRLILNAIAICLIKVRMVSGDSIGTWKAKATIVLDGLLTSTIIKPHMVQIIAYILKTKQEKTLIIKLRVS